MSSASDPARSRRGPQHQVHVTLDTQTYRALQREAAKRSRRNGTRVALTAIARDAIRDHLGLEPESNPVRWGARGG